MRIPTCGQASAHSASTGCPILVHLLHGLRLARRELQHLPGRPAGSRGVLPHHSLPHPYTRQSAQRTCPAAGVISPYGAIAGTYETAGAAMRSAGSVRTVAARLWRATNVIEGCKSNGHEANQPGGCREESRHEYHPAVTSPRSRRCRQGRGDGPTRDCRRHEWQRPPARSGVPAQCDTQVCVSVDNRSRCDSVNLGSRKPRVDPNAFHAPTVAASYVLIIRQSVELYTLADSRRRLATRPSRHPRASSSHNTSFTGWEIGSASEDKCDRKSVTRRWGG